MMEPAWYSQPGVYVDRAGSEYPEGLNPDEAIPLSRPNIRGCAEDPVIHAALDGMANKQTVGPVDQLGS
jgi:hypothetical protein